ncbi:MAG TPA: hypothetical protein VHW72_07530, partial [Candidatus Angelobacter sp.]|nr:hypothetical protein [Candidatus Angelobacter sp.]
MNSYSHWFLRQSRCDCKIPIAVPTPTQTTRLGDPPGMPKAATQAAFLCTECGLVTLYSDKDLDFEQRPTVCPFLEKRYDLVYIEVGCAGSNCESLTP